MSQPHNLIKYQIDIDLAVVLPANQTPGFKLFGK